LLIDSHDDDDGDRKNVSVSGRCRESVQNVSKSANDNVSWIASDDCSRKKPTALQEKENA